MTAHTTSTAVDEIPPPDRLSARASGSFHRRVIDALPTAVVTVDDAGAVGYANQMALELVGRPLERLVGTDALDLIHPDDHDMLLEAFQQLVADSEHADVNPDRPWAPVTFRFVRDDSETIPVEVTGRGLLHDPDVGGIVYEIRTAHERDVLQRLLTGVASGEGLGGQFGLVVDFVGAGTLDIDSAVLFAVVGHSIEPVSASTPDLVDLLESATIDGSIQALMEPAADPRFLDVGSIPGSLGEGLAALGYRDAWHIDVPDRIGGLRYVLVGLTNVRHVPAMGVRERLARAAELAEVILLRIRSHQHLERAAHYDSLTGLTNRMGLERDLEARKQDGIGSHLLYLDLDGFKPVNDRYGHHVGDEVLAVIGRRLAASTSAEDLVARIGGDEFAVVLTSSDELDPDRIAQRLMDAVTEPIRLDSGEHVVNLSIGLVDVDPYVDLEHALKAADRAMYAAKAVGGGGVKRGYIS